MNGNEKNGKQDTLDVLTMGRVGVDIYPQQVGVPLAQVETFARYLGGSATNVAVAAARHGRSSAVITKTGDDAFGDYVRTALNDFDVSVDHVGTESGLLTPVTFCEIFPPDDFPLWFYRRPIAPDLMIRTHELDMEAIENARILWVTLTGLSREPSREATMAALTARKRSTGITILDLDYRADFWEAETEATRAAEEALNLVDIAIGNREECRVAVGETEPARAAAGIRDRGVQTAVVKQGPDGVLAVSPDQSVTVPPLPVTVVNGLGAGDAFGGAFTHGLLADWDLERSIRFANAAGAIVAGELACSAAMPTTQQVEARMQEAVR